MALDFLSTPDTTFLADNLLSSEDWGDDFSRFHENGFDNGYIDASELVQDLPFYENKSVNNDLTGHVLLGNNDLSDYPWIKPEEEQNQCDTGDVFIKSEPLSPPPSSSSSDASGDSFPPVTNLPNSVLQFKLESPPLTPPRDGTDVQYFPLMNGVVKTVTPVPRIAPKQPGKPTAPPIAPKLAQPAVSKDISVGQPIVLTQADIARLTAQGVIKCQPPPTKQAKMASHHTTVTSIPVVAIPDDNMTFPPDVDIRAWKRQQRMIKNRESACLSRKKKKEYLQGLEGKMESIDQENTKLRKENERLRKRVQELINENARLKKLQSVLPSANKTATCLLVVVLLFGFNLAPFSIFSSREDDYATNRHASRALLGYSEMSQSLGQSEEAVLREHADIGRREAAKMNATGDEGVSRASLSRKELLVIRDMANYMLFEDEETSCPKFNMTESHRLADVLMGWAQKHQDEQRKHKQQKKKLKDHKRNMPKRKPAKRNRNHGRRAPAALFTEPDARALQVYDSFFQRTYNNLLDSLERRDDTFYVVSFRRDHTLLPATAHNNTQRPRMSLVMPSMGVNESSLNTPKDQISMMQIDCEVMNTKLVYLKESHIPSAKNATVTDHTVTKSSAPHHSHNRGPMPMGLKRFYHPKNISLEVPPS